MCWVSSEAPFVQCGRKLNVLEARSCVHFIIIRVMNSSVNVRGFIIIRGNSVRHPLLPYIL